MKQHLPLLLLAAMAQGNQSCDPQPTNNDIQRQNQERMLRDGIKTVGMPSIHNWRELRLAKDIYELRDQADLVTWTYIHNAMTGAPVLICKSIGFPLPYATQYSASESMQSYYVPQQDTSDRYGVTRLPQPEPNGLFVPASAEGTWVMCVSKKTGQPIPRYVEDRVDVSMEEL
jgi:hypothetical protein